MEYSKPPKTSRDPWFDNTKFVLIGLVVGGHILEAWVTTSELSQLAYFYIYLFHMPAFILISGAFSGRTRHPIQVALTMLWIYLIFQLFWTKLYSLITEEPFTLDLVHPTYAMWFLLAFPVWILAGHYLKKHRISLPLSIAASLLVGFFPQIGAELSLSRIVVFFPFFLAGTLLGPTGIKRLVPSKTVGVIGLFFASLPALVLITPDMAQQVLWGRTGYYSQAVPAPYGFAMRLVFLSTAFIASLSLFAFVPRTKCWMTTKGRSTLQVYVFHAGIVLVARHFGIIDPTPTFIGLLVGIALWIICALGLSHPTFVQLTSPLFRLPFATTPPNAETER